jgi:hypothetical protein
MDPSRESGPSIRLIELVVVIAVAVVVGGLIVSAIRKSNQASDQVQCLNNSKQMGLSIHNYATSYDDSLPALTADQSHLPSDWPYNGNIFFTLVPYMESNSFRQYAMASLPNCTWYAARGKDMPPPFSTVANMGSTNVPLCSQPIVSYQCSADGTIVNRLCANQARSRTDSEPYFFAWAAGSYAANYQVFGTENNLGSFPWGNYCGPKYRFKEIPDGNSNTVFFGEQFATCGKAAGNLWVYPGIGNYSGVQYTSPANNTPAPRGVDDSIVNTPDETNSKLWAPVFANSNATHGFTTGGHNGSIFEYNQGARTPLKEPYDAGAYWDAPPQATIDEFECDKSRLQSFHPGGIVVGMGDGSSRIVARGVSQATWHAAILPDDGQPLGTEW